MEESNGIILNVEDATDLSKDYKVEYETLLEMYNLKVKENEYLLSFVDQFKKKDYCEAGQELARTVKHLTSVNQQLAEVSRSMKIERTEHRKLESSYNDIIKSLHFNFESKLKRVYETLGGEVSKVEEVDEAVCSIPEKKVLGVSASVTNRHMDKLKHKLAAKTEEASILNNKVIHLTNKLEMLEEKFSRVKIKEKQYYQELELASGMGAMTVTEEDVDTMTVFTSIDEAVDAMPEFLKYKRLSNKLKKPVGRFAIFMNPSCTMSWNRTEKCFGNSLNHAELFSSFFSAFKQAYFIRKRGIYNGEMYIREVNCSIYAVENYAFKIEKDQDMQQEMTQYINNYSHNSGFVKNQIDKQYKEIEVLERMFTSGDQDGWAW